MYPQLNYFSKNIALFTHVKEPAQSARFRSRQSALSQILGIMRTTAEGSTQTLADPGGQRFFTSHIPERTLAYTWTQEV